MLTIHFDKKDIRNTLCKILMSKNGGSDILREYVDIIKVFIPEIAHMIGFKQNNPFHKYDVWEHTLHCLSYVEEGVVYKEYDLIVRLAVFLHDIGKPYCYSEDSDHIGHFYKHPSISVKYAKSILTKIDFEEEIIEKVLELIKYHEIELKIDVNFVKKWSNKLGKVQFGRLLQVKFLDEKGKEGNEQFSVMETSKIIEVSGILEQNFHTDFQIKDLKINGRDIIQLGFKEGKIIGIILDILFILVRFKIIDNTREALVKQVKEIQLNRSKR